MSWLEKLYQTYNNCIDHMGKSSAGTRLLPIGHTTQNAQIEIVIDENGSFRRACVVPKLDAATDIPCTEESGGRSGGKPVPHPLCDKLQYVAGDFVKFGGKVTSGFAKSPHEPHRMYLEMLSKWCSSCYKHPKVEAVFRYVKKGSVIADLYTCKILPINENTQELLKTWESKTVEIPAIFNLMPNKSSPEEAFIRWVVEIPGDFQSEVWLDKSVWSSWSNYSIGTKKDLGLCYVTGEKVQIAKQHPARLRHAADKAKLISANDGSGFTFRGRFNDATGFQACGIGFEVTQKAHNALRWLIDRQGYRSGQQVIVSWSVGDEAIPDILDNSWEFLESESDEIVVNTQNNSSASQDFALRLKRKISGYKSELGDSSSIIVLELDAATLGRSSIVYYRDLVHSEFLQRIEEWHKECCWHQNFGKNCQFIGAPSPIDIAETVCDKTKSKKFFNATIRELLPCIVDAVPLPHHLVERCVRRACNRNGIERWEWEKILGIACALYCKYTSNKRKYQMVLETNRTTRDYLFGRLLALAERLEEVALNIAGENRETNAGKLMQRFADHPYSTWMTIEKALKPYEIRLRSSRGGFLHNIKLEIDVVMEMFTPDDFMSPAKLKGEFLLGYHCQRSFLRLKKDSINSQDVTEDINKNK